MCHLRNKPNLHISILFIILRTMASCYISSGMSSGMNFIL